MPNERRQTRHRDIRHCPGRGSIGNKRWIVRSEDKSLRFWCSRGDFDIGVLMRVPRCGSCISDCTGGRGSLWSCVSRENMDDLGLARYSQEMAWAQRGDVKPRFHHYVCQEAWPSFFHYEATIPAGLTLDTDGTGLGLRPPPTSPTPARGKRRG